MQSAEWFLYFQRTCPDNVQVRARRLLFNMTTHLQILAAKNTGESLPSACNAKELFTEN